MYKAILNSKQTRSIEVSGKRTFLVGKKKYVIEEKIAGSDQIFIKRGTRQFKVRIEKIDNASKSFQLRIKGVKHNIQIQDKFDLLLEKLGYNSRGITTLNDIKAPMPGLILEINVEKGDEVKAGDKILVLEAMKMENVIKSPGKGIVKEIKVLKGNSVEKNQVMIQF